MISVLGRVGDPLAETGITHLNLSRCSRLHSLALVKHFTTHAAVRDSLNSGDYAIFKPRWSENYSARYALPGTSGKHLEELGLSSAVLLARDINSFFIPTVDPARSGLEKGVPASILYYLDLATVPQVTVRSVFNEGSCLLLSNQSWPLQVIKLTNEITLSLYQASKYRRTSVSWNIWGSGRRSWYVRDSSSALIRSVDDASGSWKLNSKRDSGACEQSLWPQGRLEVSTVFARPCLLL
ncbi:hypothetical protein N7471_010426 [Penicillium samsonianum]|uniref:uncharacterized protein n=1 Tax=Penicillium samsonianum TaxID=1882272 RepID=UPI002549261F|nr:uncharacterized protein N7471_010426 [Penicillium samsonianum]KAJ6125933.1 hypothetical protein N7471_010426 [Penicillium samsonianum]